MLDELKQRVCAANLDLVRRGLVVQTFGNVSAVDRDRGIMVIKPSGVPYDDMRAEHMVVVNLATGQTVGGSLRPSSDTATHLELYRAFPGVGGVVHTHSLYATAWAQTGRDVPALGTTHADYFEGPIPCTRLLGPEEIRHDYEANTGRAIVELYHRQDALRRPGVLVASHGPFAWGSTVEKAVDHAEILEYLVRLAGLSLGWVPGLGAMQPELLEKHFSRKHGPSAYYGQHRP